MKNSFNHQSGFALLYAVLLTGIIFTIGLGLFSIITKQIVLSSIGANSQKAYYTANSAKECALYWGIHGVDPDDNGVYESVFGYYVADEESSSGYTFIEPDNDIDITCDDNTSIPIESLGGSNNGGFKFSLGDSEGGVNINNLCAKVILTVVNPDDGSSIIESTGSNLPCSGSNNRRVERQIVGTGDFTPNTLGQ